MALRRNKITKSISSNRDFQIFPPTTCIFTITFTDYNSFRLTLASFSNILDLDNKALESNF